MKQAAGTEPKTALKITHQMRARGAERGMTYGLQCEGVVLTLVVSPSGTEEQPGPWRVDARAKSARIDVAQATEWGATRREALEAVGRSWDAARDLHGLRMFDWAAVARLLDSVRAL
jgi:hypothetical protein